MGSFKKIPETLEFDGKYPVGHPKGNLLEICAKNFEKNHLQKIPSKKLFYLIC